MGAMQCGREADCRRGSERTRGIHLCGPTRSHLSTIYSVEISPKVEVDAVSKHILEQPISPMFSVILRPTMPEKSSIESQKSPGHPAIVKHFQVGFRVLGFRKTISLSFANISPLIFVI